MQFLGIQFSGFSWEPWTMIAIGTFIAITILYIIKLKKRRIEVPFSPLWNAILKQSRKQSNFWQKFRRIFSWLLYMLIAGLFTFAIADPHFKDEISEGRHILILIDSSASMAANDVSGGANRLDIAKQKTREILKTMGPDDHVMLVNFNTQLQPLSPFVTQASILEESLRNIKVVATGTTYIDALRFAAESLREKEKGELVFISDGAGLDPELLNTIEFSKKTTIRHLKVGEKGDNLAITAFNVRRYVANKLDYELFIQIQSYFERPVNAQLEIYADGHLVDSKPFSLAPGNSFQKFYPSQAVSGEKLEARLKLISEDARDFFPLDNRAYALLPKTKQTRVQLVTDGNLYLEGPLYLNSNLITTKTAPADYDPKLAYDITIFDRVAPKTPDTGNFLYISPKAGPNSPWEIKKTIADPIITREKKNHPLLRWIGLKTLNIGAADQWKLTAKDRTLVSSALGVPILVTRNEGEKKIVGLSFDIRNSDFPLRVAFPVLLINLVDYFAYGDSGLLQSYKTGNTWSVAVSQDATSASILTPDQQKNTAPVYNGRAIFYGEKTGIYEIRGEDFETVKIAANLSNIDESKILPSDLKLNETPILRDTSALIFERNELWIWAILAGFLLLLIEWWTYSRRKTV